MKNDYRQLLSIRFRVEKTYCLYAGRGRSKTTNVYLERIEAGEERFVGLLMLDLQGDRSDLAGKVIEVTATVESEEQS